MKHLKKGIIEFFSHLTHIEYFFIFIYLITLFIGIWYAFPNLASVGDESGPYIWGVLDAFHSRTIVPHVNYSYTLSFYANYISLGLVGIFGFGGNFDNLIALFNKGETYLFLLPRFLSALFTIITLFLFLRLAKYQAVSLVERMSIAALVFTNIIFVTIAHTGKMYMLSLALFFLSFYFLEASFRLQQELVKIPWYKNPLCYSIFFSFLSIANSPFNLISLLNVVYIYYFFFKTESLRKKIIVSTLVAAALLIVSVLVNQYGWFAQTEMTPASSISDITQFIFSYIITGTIMIMPLSLLCILFIKKVRNKRLFWISASYLLAYFLILLLKVNWVGNDPSHYWRYLVYPVFLVGLILLFVELSTRKVLYLCVAVSTVFFVKTLYLLSIPTTVNLMDEYIDSNIQDSLLINRATEFTPYTIYTNSTLDDHSSNAVLRMKATADVSQLQYSTIQPLFGTRNFLSMNLIDNREQKIPGKLLFKVENGASSPNYFAAVEHNLGPYNYHFLFLDRLGRPLYLYDLDFIR